MKNNLLFLLTLTFLVYGCSGSDDHVVDLDAINWEIEIKNVTATTITIDPHALSSGEDYEFGYSKKGESDYTAVSIFDNEIKGLEPLTEYELGMFNPLNNEKSSKILPFKTLPFDIHIDGYNGAFDLGKLRTSEGEINSWKIENVVADIKSISAKLISVESENNVVDLENVHIANDSLYFTIPDDLVPQEPYESSHDYYIEYSINDNNYRMKAIRGAEQLIEPVLYVKNKTLYIIGGSTKYKTMGTCNWESMIELYFYGYFFSHSINSPDYVPDEDVTAIITNLDNNSDIIIQPMNEDPDCIMFTRLYGSGYYFMNMRNYASAYPTGNYKIRFTFNKDNKYYETNEYFFTIEE